MDEKTKIVTSYGHLYTMYKNYYLLKPEPIVGDSWEGDNCYRFLVVPSDPIAIEKNGSNVYHVFGFPRHVVTNCFTIEFANIIEIHVQANDEVIIEDNRKEIEENDEKDEFPF